MRTAWADQLRRIARELSQNGKKPVNTQSLCAAVGAEDVEAKARVRRSVNHMVKRGELVRMRDGVFSVAPARMGMMQRDGLSYRRMWLIIRTEKAGWTVAAIAGTTRLHNSTVSKYCLWLLDQGFIIRCGKNGNERLFRVTAKGADHVATPFPPVTEKDPYQRERSAAARLARAFMEPDPSRQREKIVEECRVILSRFTSQDDKLHGFSDEDAGRNENFHHQDAKEEKA